MIEIQLPPSDLYDTDPRNDPDYGRYHVHFPPFQPGAPKRAPGETPPIIVIVPETI